jgi:hypothetical protein
VLSYRAEPEELDEKDILTCWKFLNLNIRRT